MCMHIVQQVPFLLPEAMTPQFFHVLPLLNIALPPLIQHPCLQHSYFQTRNAGKKALSAIHRQYQRQELRESFHSAEELRGR